MHAILQQRTKCILYKDPNCIDSMKLIIIRKDIIVNVDEIRDFFYETITILHLQAQSIMAYSTKHTESLA